MDFKFIINNYVEILTKKYFCFEGRADRKTFWFFVLVNAVVGVILGAIPSIGQWLNLIYCLATICPSLGLNVRRMHDIGKSGWFILINLIPLVGPIIYLVLCCQPSIPGEYQK